jgi:uncharacterized protein
MTWVWLCLAAFGAGVVNAVAGGGTLLTFPTLIWVLAGIPGAEVLANGTSTSALLPSSIGSMWGYRREFAGTRIWIRWLLGPSLVGGAIGACLVIWLDERIFSASVPWLILVATVLLALQPAIARWTGVGKPHHPATTATLWTIAGFQFLVAVYGGYFGAGIGILMLAALSFMGLADIHQMNGLKSLFGTAINGVAAAIFIASGQVSWPHALPMMAAAICGGFCGATVARKLDRTLVRRLVVALGFALSSFYFWRTYG